MDTARIRKAFKYPDEIDTSDDSHDELDEEEQEKLISDFRAKEAENNGRYNLIFSILPLTVITPFLYYLFGSSHRSSTSLLCLLAITSLLATAYTMRYIPAEASLKLKKPSRRSSSPREIGPIETYLPVLNPVISAFLFLASWLLKGEGGNQEGLWLFLWLPGVVLAMITIARKSMADIQAGIGELDGMKYGYKGA